MVDIHQIYRKNRALKYDNTERIIVSCETKYALKSSTTRLPPITIYSVISNQISQLSNGSSLIYR